MIYSAFVGNNMEILVKMRGTHITIHTSKYGDNSCTVSYSKTESQLWPSLCCTVTDILKANRSMYIRKQCYKSTSLLSAIYFSSV